MTEIVRTPLDAIELLMQDHREVESLFAEFQYLQQNRKNTADVIALACAELRIHDTLENELFYPAVSSAAGDDSVEALLDDAEDAHDSVLDLIDDLEDMDDIDARNTQFKLIVAETQQHIAQEESELFPKAMALTQLDLDALASAMKLRKNELTAEVEPPETVLESA
jgi:hemerythrin superfamily protein